MSYSLPFAYGDRVIELGGGDAPSFRPNVDARPGPQTDFTADFNGPLPIRSEEWNGVYVRYCLEHISWRNVRGFLGEVHRILRPGGVAVLVTANLLEQARLLVAVGDRAEWEDLHACMVFGDQDYPENLHRSGFSPEFACRLLREAGFDRVIVVPHGDLRTDMVLEARKMETV